MSTRRVKPLTAAAIDVGTNSVKIVAAQMHDYGAVRVLADSSIIARLGEGVDTTHVLSPEAQARTAEAIALLLKSVRSLKIDKLRVVATSAVRDAENRDDFIRMVRAEAGVELEVLSEADEGRLSYSAVSLDPDLEMSEGEEAVVDAGGGSTELTFGVGGRISFSTSMKLGAVRLTERVLISDPPSASELSEARAIAEQVVSEAADGRWAGRVIGVGGSVVNLARVFRELPPERTREIHASTISPVELGHLTMLLGGLSVERRKALIGLEPKRADVILGGAIILDRVLAVLGADEMVVSIRGLRYGVIYELLGIGE